MYAKKCQIKSETMRMLACLMLCTPSVAFAAAPGGHASISHLLWYVINFSIYTFVIFMIARRPFMAFWVKRAERIEDQVKKGERDLAAAQALLEQAQQKVSAFTDQERARMIEALAAEGAREAQFIKASGAEQIATVKNQVQLTLAAEQKSSESRVRSDVAGVILDRAEAKVRTEYSQERDQQRRQSALGGMSTLVQ